MKKSELRMIIKEEVGKYLTEDDGLGEVEDEAFRMREDEEEEMLSGDPEKMASEMVGDGNLPNKYWVYKNTLWYTNKGQDESNVFDWSVDVYEDAPDRSEFLGMFDTFSEAVRVAEGEYLPSPEDEWDDFHSVYIEDRITGVLFQGVWHETVQTHNTRFKNGSFSTFDFSWDNDSSYTEKEMEKRGETFR